MRKKVARQRMNVEATSKNQSRQKNSYKLLSQSDDWKFYSLL